MWFNGSCKRRRQRGLGLIWLLSCAVSASAQSDTGLPSFVFSDPTACRQWQSTHDLAPLVCTSTGMVARITGADPYLTGPARNYPAGKLLWLHLRLKSDQGGLGQIFYFTQTATEANSVRFPVPAQQWHEVQVPMPALGANYRLRIDPPGSGGSCLLERLWFEERVVFSAPVWPKPGLPALGAEPVSVQSGELKLTHSRTAVGGFEVEVAGWRMAVGNTQALLGYVVNNEVRWVPVRTADGGTMSVQAADNSLVLHASWADPDGGRWNLSQRFSAGTEGALNVESTVAVDQDRAVLYLPLWTLLPGLGNYGTNKNQAILAGVEYLENEPSSSEADVTGPGAWRLAPDSLKLTFPLLAIQSDERYLALTWEEQPSLCAIFDSPDRHFHSGGHLMGLLFPGSDGSNREERSLIPYRPEWVRAGQPVRLRATLLGGRGTTVIPALQQYVRLAGLPAVPNPGYTASEYYELAARGWLESRIRETNLFRHAWWPGFGLQAAADAALWMEWLAGKVGDAGLASKLSEASAGALSVVPRANYNSAHVGHVHYPVAAGIFGAVLENAAQAQSQGESLLRRFGPDGAVLYQPPAGGVDYARTHWSREANGLTASVVAGLLEAAVYSGDPALIDAGLRHLRAMTKFRHTVPRGAQTWEIPLHTPDILASAYLVRCYTLGHELTGDPEWLDEARYWAWTGVPFVYLRPPTTRPVGVFGTIPVLGATGWVAPLWIGLPVQWCGLVYADALYRFAKHDPKGPWQHLADGIAAAGIQHTWPLTDPDRKGLLPDSFQLRAQLRDGPAINPATVQVPALRFFREPPPYEFHAFNRFGLRAHVPGVLSDLVEQREGVAFTVRPWSPRPCWLLINGVWQEPQVTINGQKVALVNPHQYQKSTGRLVLYLEKTSTIALTQRVASVMPLK